MNEIQNSFLQAIQTLTDNSIAHSNATMTVKAEITEVVSISQGIYKARYLNDSLTVYATQNLEYSVGNIVYILIPDGNFSNKKLILGNAAAIDEVSTQVDSSATIDEYYDISDNLITDLEYAELCSYKDTTSNRGSYTLSEEAKNKIIEYLKYYNTFYFGVTIQTALDITQKARNGLYGITLSIPLISADGDETKLDNYVKEIQIDPSNILGSPYALEIPTPQGITFAIDTTQLTINPDKDITITWFSKTGDDSFVDKSNKPADIFLTNFIFKTVEALPESVQQGYSLTIEATQGTLFTDNDSVDEIKTLTPTVRYNGNKITLRSDTICYWFVEDASINARSEGYVSHAGAGWRCLNKVDEEDNPVSALSIDVTKNDLVKELKYKCVIIYDKNVISNTITLVNVNSSIELKLTTSTGETQYSKKTEYVELKMTVIDGDELTNLSFSWSRKDKNGQIIQDGDYEVFQIVESTSTSSTVKLSTLLIDELNTVSCTVIKEDKIILGTKSLTITVGEIQIPPYRLVINNGDRVYKYDSDGDSPMIANYDGPLSSIVSAIKPLTYQIFRADGTEFTETDYRLCSYTWKIPKNSLIQQVDEDNVGESPDYYLVSGNGGGIEGDYTAQLNYKIASKFNNNKSDNNITLEVKFNEAVLEEKTNMFFLKEGASGTNGTKYAAVITYDGYKYGEKDINGYEQKLRVYFSTANNQYFYTKSDYRLYSLSNNSVLPFFNVDVYEDGEKLSSENYTVEFSWFDKKILNPCLEINKLNGKIRVLKGISTATPSEDPSNANLHIAEAKITITRSDTESSIDTKTVLYAYYPIEMIIYNRVLTASIDARKLYHLEGGFSEVLYATDGTNPQYNSSSLFQGVSKSIVGTVNSFGHLKIKNLNNTSFNCVPDSKYDNGNTRNFIAIKTSYFEIVQPIVFLYNRYEMSNLNGWDGNKLYLDKDGEGSYILAPQIGAGIKHTNNTFTGVVMGIRKTTANTGTADVGLFGYHQGQQSFFLDAEDGSASFGVSGKGQIEIVPSEDKAIIQSGNFSTTNKTGMQIDLTTPSIKWGNGNFSVDSNGYGTLKGGGSIAGWIIGDETLTGGNVTLNKNGNLTGKNWYINNDGSTKFGNLTINSNGDITANGGTFTGITVNGNSTFSGKLSGATGTFSGELSAASGTFKGTLSSASGTFSGELNAASGTFKGTLSAATGSINSITATNLTVTSGKISLGNTVLSSSSSDTSTIGGWTIGAKSLTSGSANSNNFIGLYSSYDGNENYRIVVGNKKFTVDREGYMVAKAGRIGDWEVSDGALSGDDIVKLTPSGVYYTLSVAGIDVNATWRSICEAGYNVNRGETVTVTIGTNKFTFNQGILTSFGPA